MHKQVDFIQVRIHESPCSYKRRRNKTQSNTEQKTMWNQAVRHSFPLNQKIGNAPSHGNRGNIKKNKSIELIAFLYGMNKTKTFNLDEMFSTLSKQNM